MRLAPLTVAGFTPAAAAHEAHERRALQLRARYDAAVTTPENAAHWANADALGPLASANPAVRATLRARARYEAGSNPYVDGVLRTIADDTVGPGPRLQILGEDDRVNTLVEESFAQWCDAVGLGALLRLMRESKTRDGEIFGLLTENPRIPHPVKTDLRPIECDQVATPLFNPAQPVDGIVFDAWGNPRLYHVLKVHPGETYWPGVDVLPLDFVAIPAADIVHYFRARRAGQRRGVPELASSLQLFADRRRYRGAVLAAAEVAAAFAGVVQTDAPPGAEPQPAEPWDSFTLEHRALTTLPAGWKLGQMEAQQPTGTYAETDARFLNEATRPISMPRNVATCDSSNYNYASGRLDHQTYDGALQIERVDIARIILRPLLARWIAAARQIPGNAARLLKLDAQGLPAHQWFWRGREHVDPVKEAQADEIDLRNGATTLAAIYARRGEDWQPNIEQRGRELAAMRDNGLLSAAPAPAATADAPEEAAADAD